MAMRMSILVTALLLSLGTAWCDEAAVVVPFAADGVQRIEIVGDDYYFKPSHIIVKVNKPVELLVRKLGWFIPHDFVINAPEAGIVVNESLSRDPVKITFTPTKTGIYPYYCSKKPPFMKSHRDEGMEGKLEVVE